MDYRGISGGDVEPNVPVYPLASHQSTVRTQLCSRKNKHASRFDPFYGSFVGLSCRLDLSRLIFDIGCGCVWMWKEDKWDNEGGKVMKMGCGRRRLVQTCIAGVLAVYTTVFLYQALSRGRIAIGTRQQVRFIRFQRSI